jgi:hypothetical protein
MGRTNESFAVEELTTDDGWSLTKTLRISGE